MRATGVLFAAILVRISRYHVFAEGRIYEKEAQNAAVDVTRNGEIARVGLNSGAEDISRVLEAVGGGVLHFRQDRGGAAQAT